MNWKEFISSFTETVPLYPTLRDFTAANRVDIQATDLTKDIIPQPVRFKGSNEGFAPVQIRFALGLFRETASIGGYNNLLLSPLSVMLALSMTANGADNDTLTEMESVLGMSVQKLNENFSDYLYSSIDENCLLYLANSLWIKEDYDVKQDFLQISADYYGASVYSSPFDEQTVTDVNNWVKAKTDGMIENMLGSVSPGASMYIINALAFDAKWANAYTSDSVEEGVFTASDGTKRKVKFLHETRYGIYLEDCKSTGFIKNYEGGRYAFAAILPKKGITLKRYINKLTAEKLYNMLKKPASYKTVTAIPKFSYNYDAALGDVLKQLGMPSAFNPAAADFTRLGTTKLHIDDVLHKTFIEVNEDGTRAGASTVVPLMLLSAPPGRKEKEIIKYVTLDRPFLFLIIDRENNTPVFMGTVTDIN